MRSGRRSREGTRSAEELEEGLEEVEEVMEELEGGMEELVERVWSFEEYRHICFCTEKRVNESLERPFIHT